MVGSSFPGPTNGCIRGDNNNPNPSTCAIRSDPRCGTSEEVSGIGDPAFLLLVPDEQLRSDYVVLTPTDYVRDHLTAIVRAGATVTLDGAPIGGTRTAIPGTLNEVIRIEVQDGPHDVRSSEPFALYSYGYDCDVSYAYAGGLNFVTGN